MTQKIDIRKTSPATPAAVWQLLGDSATWPTWTPIDRHEGVRSGGSDGTGEVRIFHTGRHTVREEIVERTPERRLSYTLLAGLALRDYRADIDLTPTPTGGTEVRWHTTFVAKVPGTGWIYRSALGKITKQLVDVPISAARGSEPSSPSAAIDPASA
jgi:uncharacterized protein YndB with AHSA1/START domain